MRVDIWLDNQDITDEFHPEATVYTMELDYTDKLLKCWLLCDVAWTEEREIEEHPWRKKSKDKTRVISMTLDEYIMRHYNECNPMNAFWAIGRAKFTHKLILYWVERGYRKSYPDKNYI